MWYLKIETDEEWRALVGALAFVAAHPGAMEHTARLVTELRERLVATPESRHGGLVTVEDANYLPSAPARCEGHVRDQSGTTRNGQRTCGLTLSTDGTCPGVELHVAKKEFPAPLPCCNHTVVQHGMVGCQVTACRCRRTLFALTGRA